MLIGSYFCTGALAQSTYGTMLGTLKDPQGSVVAAGKVVLTDKGKGTARTEVSNENGDYRFNNIDPGTYELTVEVAGFEGIHFADLVLLASETKRVDAVLTVGSVAQSVLVDSGAAAVINTDVSNLAETKTGLELTELPVAITSRSQGSTSPMSTLTTQPGVQTDSSGNLSIMGAIPNMFEMTIDGISSMGGFNSAPINELFPSFNAIEEIRINEVNASAEYGGVANISTVSKSGTSKFHGGGFENWQNSVLDAQNPFSITKPTLNLNDYGAYGGGPVRLPGLRRGGEDKTFFFAGYEGLSLTKQTTLVESMPTLAMRSGDLSAYNSAGQIYNPYTGAAYPNNQIPQSQITGLATGTLAALYPLPNYGGAGAIANNYSTNIPTPVSSQQGDGRIDETISAKQTAFIRGNFKKRSVVLAPTAGNTLTATPVVGGVSEPEEDFGATAAYNYIFSPNLLNEFRTGLTGNRTSEGFGVSASAIAATLGISDLKPPSGDAVPDFAINGFQVTGGGSLNSQSGNQRTIQLLDNISWTKKGHSLKFGGDYKRLSGHATNVYAAQRLGVYNFTGALTNLPNSQLGLSGNYLPNNPYIGNPFAAFLLGIPDVTQLDSVVEPDCHSYANGYDMYGQDDWKVNRNLTLNFGLRYEYHPMWRDHLLNSSQFLPDYYSIENGVAVHGAVVIPDGAFSILDPIFAASTAPTPIIGAREAGIPQSLRFSQKTDFAPRFGFAWRPFGDNKTALRGGFGKFIDSPLGNLVQATYAIHSADQGIYNQNIAANGTPSLVFPHPFPANLAVPGSQFFQQASNIHDLDSSVYQWNITFERDMGHDIAMQLSYSGNHGANLKTQINLDQLPPNTAGFAAEAPYAPYPLWQEVEQETNGGRSNYNTISATLQKRLSHGLQFHSNYSFARDLTDAQGGDPSSVVNDFNVFRTNVQDPHLDYGNVTFTRRHRFLTTGLYQLPFGRGRTFLSSANPLLDGFVGGWELAGVVLLQSGPFLTANVPGSDPSGTGFENLNPPRPDRVAGVPFTVPGKGLAQWLNPAALTVPQNNIGRFGNSSVGSIPGIGSEQTSISLLKSVNLGEGMHAQFGAQVANVLNHVNYEQPSTTCNVLPGQVCTNAGGYGQVYAVQSAEGAGPRTVQITGRFTF